MTTTPLQLVCPAGTLAALKAAVQAGADVVYLGFRDETNARNFPGLNFSREELIQGIRYAHAENVEIYVAINTFVEAGRPEPWHQAVDDAHVLGADAVILADIGLLDYAKQKHPDLRLHLSVQASASNPESIGFYHQAFGIKRVVLPRVLTFEQIRDLCRQIPVETEVFAFGGLCVMAEGRCSLSSYVTGCSPNMSGVCSPASHVRYQQSGGDLVSRLGEFTINSFPEGEAAGYPTLCKGRFQADGEVSYLFEEPTSLNVSGNLQELVSAGVSALKIEGRQRGKAYVAEVVSSFRQAVDALAGGRSFENHHLGDLSEGGRDTMGAFKKTWR